MKFVGTSSDEKCAPPDPSQLPAPPAALLMRSTGSTQTRAPQQQFNTAIAPPQPPVPPPMHPYVMLPPPSMAMRPPPPFYVPTAALFSPIAPASSGHLPTMPLMPAAQRPRAMTSHYRPPMHMQQQHYSGYDPATPSHEIFVPLQVERYARCPMVRTEQVYCAGTAASSATAVRPRCVGPRTQSASVIDAVK